MARDIERRKKWRNEWARNGETLSWKDAKDAAVLSARADKVERTIASHRWRLPIDGKVSRVAVSPFSDLATAIPSMPDSFKLVTHRLFITRCSCDEMSR